MVAYCSVLTRLKQNEITAVYSKERILNAANTILLQLNIDLFKIVV